MTQLNKLIANLIARAAGDANVVAAQKQLVNVAELIGAPYDPATSPDGGSTVLGQIPILKNLCEGTLITGVAAKESLKEAYALLITATTVVPT